MESSSSIFPGGAIAGLLLSNPSLSLLLVVHPDIAEALLSSKLAECLFLKANCIIYCLSLASVNFLGPCPGVLQ